MTTNTVDADLLKLTGEAQAGMDSLRARGARESAFLAAKEELADRMVELLGQTLAKLTPEEKVAAFDKLAQAQVELKIAEVKGKLEGNHYRDEDEDHYTVEAVESAVFGRDFHKAFNAMGDVFEATAKAKD